MLRGLYVVHDCCNMWAVHKAALNCRYCYVCVYATATMSAFSIVLLVTCHNVSHICQNKYLQHHIYIFSMVWFNKFYEFIHFHFEMHHAHYEYTHFLTLHSNLPF